MSGLVGGDELLLPLGVADRLAQPDLAHQPGVLDVRPRHGGGAAPDGVDERLVEQMLDHDGCVSLGDAGERVPTLRVVEHLLVRLPGEEVVHELATSGLVWRVEAEPAIEPTRP